MLIERNKSFEPYGESALLNLHTNLACNQDQDAYSKNDQVKELLDATNLLSSEDPADDAVILNDTCAIPATVPTIISDVELNVKLGN